MRTKKSIIEEYLSYGYSLEEIAEINGFKYNYVYAVYKMAIHRSVFKQLENHRSWVDWERIPFSKYEDDYGKQPIPTYKWHELCFEEQFLELKENHKEMADFGRCTKI